MRVSGDWKLEHRVLVEDFVDDGLWAALAAEAAAGLSNAVRQEHSKVAARRDGSFASPTRFSTIAAGPALTGLLRSRELVALARELTGLPRLVPARSSYNYYGRGDYIGLHRDALRCSVTFTFALDELEPMWWAPQLSDVDSDTLAELVQTQGPCPAGFEQFDVPPRRLNGFNGYDIPHWRAPSGQDRALLGSVCYFDL